jgi:hypothetical protein
VFGRILLLYLKRNFDFSKEVSSSFLLPETSLEPGRPETTSLEV